MNEEEDLEDLISRSLSLSFILEGFYIVKDQVYHAFYFIRPQLLRKCIMHFISTNITHPEHLLVKLCTSGKFKQGYELFLTIHLHIRRKDLFVGWSTIPSSYQKKKKLRTSR